MSHLQEAVSRMQWNILKTEHSKTEVTNEEDLVGLSSLVLGPPIAKGCSAVVYAARKKQGTSNTWKCELLCEEVLLTFGLK